MFSSTSFIHVENDYHRERLRRSFRPLLPLRAAQALTRNRTKRVESAS